MAETRLSKKLTFLKQNVQLWADLGSILRLRSKHISSKQQQTQTPKFRRARKQTKCNNATTPSRTVEEAMLASELLGRPSLSLGLQFRAVEGMSPTTIQNSIGFSNSKSSTPRRRSGALVWLPLITDVLRQLFKTSKKF